MGLGSGFIVRLRFRVRVEVNDGLRDRVYN